MGVRAHAGADRLRTIWTPEMDRYFIELMLEQVRKGNRIDDHLFSKGAWKTMSSLFNTKFKFQYEKDVLKNRHKTLRNLYRATKNLLDQKGFSWDETRKRVTADNNLWDDHIKANPDARCYRIKSIPYYNDLCEIYADATLKQTRSIADQNGSANVAELHLHADSVPEAGKTMETALQLNNHEATPEPLDDIVIDKECGNSASMGVIDDLPQPTPLNTSTVATRTRTYWQPPMDRYFIDLMLEQVNKGSRVDGSFRKQAWTDMMASFNSKFGFNYEVDILKNRYKTLKRQYKVVKNIVDLDGFVWDEARQMVTADDSIWQDYFKTHTDARQYMTRPVLYYKDLCVICKESSVDERESFLLHNVEVQKTVPGIKLSRPITGFQSPAASVSRDDRVSDEEESSDMGFKITVTDPKNKHHLENSSTSACSKKARTKEEGMADAIREMASVVSLLADKRKDDDSYCIPIENVIEAVQALPDMDEDLVLDACDFLEDEKKAKTFLALDIKLRKKWLIRKLRQEPLSSTGVVS